MQELNMVEVDAVSGALNWASVGAGALEGLIVGGIGGGIVGAIGGVIVGAVAAGVTSAITGK